MSTRVVRKLKGRDDGLKTLASLAQDSPEENSENEEVQQRPLNPFALLGGGEEEDNQETKEKSEDECSPKIEIKTPPNGARRKTNKKKKKKQKPKNNVENHEDIDKVVNEIAQLDENSTNIQSSNISQMKKSKYILTVEHRFLDPDNELRRIFGSRTLMEDTNYRQRNRARTLRSSWLTAPTSSWPRLTKTGLSMTCIERSQKYLYFAYEHNKDYQKAQFQFLDAVDSSNHHLVAEVLRNNSYHIDSLLTLSEVCRVNDDSQMARELIERALYAFEMNFHSQFSLATGHCRLQYKIPENRGLFLALYRHLHFVFQRGCGRTALELCKVLLNLDPDEDPLCVLLFIDFFALQAGEYEFLIQLFSEWEAHKNLSQLPNFAFSLALAHFELAQIGNKDFSTANEQLQDALIRFPAVVSLLLDACSIHPSPRVKSHAFFNKEATDTSPGGLILLCELFVKRNSPLWKTEEILPWLEKNVDAVLDRVDAKDPEVAKWRPRRKKYEKPPRNIYRYTVVSDVPGVISKLPPEIRLEPILGHDPLPPADSVVSYQRPERTRRGRAGNSLGLFLHSLLPEFDPNEEAAADAGRATLHEQFQTLMGAMRDMLGNFQLQPEEGEEEEEEFREDEWD